MRYTRYLIFSISLCCALAPAFVHSVSDSFTVQTLVGSDSIAPTAPSNLLAQAISVDQINLDWDASSDNVAVSGYQIYRDALQIATTSLTSYSDTGLASDTMYTYYVTAFDAAFNLSSSSNVAATATLASPVVAVEDESTEGSYFGPIRVFNIEYTPGRSYIDISYQTSVYARSIIRWGQTGDFESGYISTNAYNKSHTTRIDDLMPGTIYEIEVSLTDRSGRNQIHKTLIIKTDDVLDVIAPPNVSGLTAELVPTGVSLFWEKPVVSDFSHVRVLSSDLFYPIHSADGWLVYEGDEELIVDARELAEGIGRYYTVFAYDVSGNFSSGAVIYIARGEGGNVQYVPARDINISTGMDVDQLFSFREIDFIQNNDRISFHKNYVVIDSELETLVSIPYDELPEHLKTIVVHLIHPENIGQSFSFLLRVNRNKTAYEARFAPLATEAIYPTSVDVFNYNTKQLLVATGTIESKRIDTEHMASESWHASYLRLIILLTIGVLLFCIYYFLYFRHRDED